MSDYIAFLKSKSFLAGAGSAAILQFGPQLGVPDRWVIFAATAWGLPWAVIGAVIKVYESWPSAPTQPTPTNEEA
jgi:hypothetical protein